VSPPRRPGDDGRGGRRPDKTSSPRGEHGGAPKRPNRAKIRAVHSNAPKHKDTPKIDAPVRAPRSDKPQPRPQRGPRQSERPTTERPANARTARTGAFTARRDAERREDAAERPVRPERAPSAAPRGDRARPERGADRARPERSPERLGERARPERGSDRSNDRARPERAPQRASERARPERVTERTNDNARPERTSERPNDRVRPERGAARPTDRKPRERGVPAGPRIRRDGSAAIGRGRQGDAPPIVHGKREPQRIAKLLARAGIASRREVERMIEEGRIAIDGKLLETAATIVDTLQGITVDGQPVEAPSHARLFIFHKPTGFLTTERDPRGRPTIYDRLPADLPRVMPIGRLDLNTEGLLLLTTDGELKRKMELPASGIPRVYRARAYGEITQEQLETLMDGVEIEGVRYGPIDANMERRTGRNVWIEIRITEGKNREVRRVLEYLGLQVSRLIRVAYGEFILADLPAGELVEVRQNDLVAFRQTLK
jgi:23S rRNA pseudouridine2605 synthase